MGGPAHLAGTLPCVYAHAPRPERRDHGLPGVPGMRQAGAERRDPLSALRLQLSSSAPAPAGGGAAGRPLLDRDHGGRGRGGDCAHRAAGASHTQPVDPSSRRFAGPRFRERGGADADADADPTTNARHPPPASEAGCPLHRPEHVRDSPLCPYVGQRPKRAQSLGSTRRCAQSRRLVLVDSLVRGWYRVLVDGRTVGYASRSLLEATPPE